MVWAKCLTNNIWCNLLTGNVNFILRPFMRLNHNLSLFLSVTGLYSAPRLWFPAWRTLLGHAEGDDGDDPHLGPAEARLPSHLHSHLRQPGQHVSALPPPHQALALLWVCLKNTICWSSVFFFVCFFKALISIVHRKPTFTVLLTFYLTSVIRVT